MLINPPSIQRMRVEKDEVAWTEIYFESKLQCHQTNDARLRKVMAATKMLTVEIQKALNFSRIHSITRVREDLEFLVSRWSVKSHTFIAVWRGVWPDT